MDERLEIISAVLRLTGKTDFVMDAKGSSVFRRRPFYYVLETITIRRLELGLIQDNIPERLIATRTPMAILSRMPPRARNFIVKNYRADRVSNHGVGKNAQKRSKRNCRGFIASIS